MKRERTGDFAEAHDRVEKTRKRAKTKDRERKNDAAKTRLGYGEEGVPSKHLILFRDTGSRWTSLSPYIDRTHRHLGIGRTPVGLLFSLVWQGTVDYARIDWARCLKQVRAKPRAAKKILAEFDTQWAQQGILCTRDGLQIHWNRFNPAQGIG
jgi:hypothetical protein